MRSELFRCVECYTEKISKEIPRGWVLVGAIPRLSYNTVCETCFEETRQKNPDVFFVDPNPVWKESPTTKYPKEHIEILWTRQSKMGYTTLVEWAEKVDSRRYLAVFTSHTKADSIVKAIQDAALGIVTPFTEEAIARAVEKGEPYGTV